MTDRTRDLPYDFDLVSARLGEAGMTLLAIRMTGLRPSGMRGYWPDIPGAGSDAERSATPSPRRISEMEEALRWVSLIPAHEVKLRKLVNARALTSPRSAKPIYSWKKLGAQLGCSEATAKTWWIRAIDMIVLRLNRPGFCEQLGGVGTKQRTAAAIASATSSTRHRALETI